MTDVDEKPEAASGKLKEKDYQRELARLHVEMVKLQLWAVHERLRVCILFEGRDGAGKGGEKSQIYFQRYIRHLPSAGEIVIFDRSWYNRAGVERVMGFCTEKDVEMFLEMVPLVEKAIVESGIIFLKYWLEISQEEQARRLEARINDGRKIWKLSSMDLQSYSRWYDYSRARDAMFRASDLPWAPWYVVHSNDKNRARLNLITHLLKHIPYKELPRDKVKLPARQKPHGYKEPDYPFKMVPELTWPSK